MGSLHPKVEQPGLWWNACTQYRQGSSLRRYKKSAALSFQVCALLHRNRHKDR